MSKSYRHYSGYGHEDSHTKQGKQWKKIRHGQMRSRLRDDYDEYQTLGKKCHRANRYDVTTDDEEMEELEMSFKTEGYDVNRMRHKKFGK